ncbi:MAG: hypothetical protein ACI4QL_00665 [Candidatus Fimimonas sp.]
MKKQVSAKTMLAKTCASFAISLVFLALSVVTFAWMASNRTVTATGFSIQARADFSEVGMGVHPVTAIDDANGTYTFLPATNVTSLPKYDKYQIDTVTYEKALVLDVAFSTTSSAINLSVAASGSFSANAADWGTAQSLSNVVKFFVATSISETQVSTSGEGVSFASVQTVDNVQTVVRTAESEIALLTDFAVTPNQPQHIYVVVVYNTDVADYYCAHTELDVAFANDVTFNINKAGEEA